MLLLWDERLAAAASANDRIEAECPTASETNEIIREHFEPGTCQRCNGEHYQDEKHTRTFKDDALYRSGYGRPSSVLAEHIRQQREQEGAV
jgi:hypothetical protein